MGGLVWLGRAGRFPSSDMDGLKLRDVDGLGRILAVWCEEGV